MPLIVAHGCPNWHMQKGKTRSAHTNLFGTREWVRHSRCSVIVAHPDDEVIGAGGLISQLANVTILHVTDGAPINREMAKAAGFEQSSDYARVRREECVTALALANVPEERIVEFGVADHQAPYSLSHLTKRLTRFLQRSAPNIVLTHPYEGGHPDHDATAFATHAAVRLLQRNGLSPPVLFEMALHPGNDGENRVLDFLPSSGREITTFMLDEAAKELKRRMFNCFVTQREVLNKGPLGPERFRRSPGYDFAQPPNSGKPNYERFECGITGVEWQSLARKAWGDLFPEEAMTH